jgi:hypothetical protein
VKGTIDPVETFFTSIHSVWGRALAMFGSCWVAFAFGVLAAHVSWGSDGLSLSVSAKELALVPVAWMFSLLAGMLKWWGILYMPFLIAVFYVAFYVESNLFRLVSLTFSGQALHTWLLSRGEIEDIPHRPISWLLIGAIGLLAWLSVKSWQRDHT